ncbi:MAG TPA: DUF2939 domain-containing protein [Allosphingosinicella sp.]
MTRNKRIAIAAAALVALAAGWYFGSPRWTLWQMSRAAEARDSEKLAAYIDFPTLRETTREQMKAQLAAKARQGGGADDGFGALGAMMGLAMIDPMIDGLLTPETMRMAFEKVPDVGDSGAEAGGSGADKRGSGAGAGGSGAGASAAGGNKGPLGIDPDDMKLVHKGPNEFRLRKKDAKGEAGDLIFRRHGLGWKLEEVRLDRPLG